MDPVIVGLLATYGGKLIDKLLEAGWVPTSEDLRKMTERRKKALEDFRNAAPTVGDDDE